MKTISCVWNIGYKIRWKEIGFWVKMMTIVSQRELCVPCTTGHDFLISIHCYCTNYTDSCSGFQEMKQIVPESYTYVQNGNSNARTQIPDYPAWRPAILAQQTSQVYSRQFQPSTLWGWILKDLFPLRNFRKNTLTSENWLGVEKWLSS